MKASDCMSRDVEIVSPKETIMDAACIMRAAETGFLPVGENDRLIGTLTDRDIVVRGIAEKKNADSLVSDVMTTELVYCFEDDDLDDVAAKMSDNQVRRLPVLNRQKRLVGVISLGDIAKASDDDGVRAGETLSGVSEAGGRHSH